MKIWAAVYPEDIYEDPYIVVLCDDGDWDPYGFVVWNAVILFLCSFSFQSSDVGAVDGEGSFGVVWGNGAVSYQVVLKNVCEFLFGRSADLFI